jgi:hypothetical protein
VDVQLSEMVGRCHQKQNERKNREEEPYDGTEEHESDVVEVEKLFVLRRFCGVGISQRIEHTVIARAMGYAQQKNQAQGKRNGVRVCLQRKKQGDTGQQRTADAHEKQE